MGTQNKRGLCVIEQMLVEFHLHIDLQTVQLNVAMLNYQSMINFK